jgi:hypothetical protein
MARRSIRDQEAENADLIATLAVIPDPVAVELADRMQRCRSDRHQRRIRPKTYVAAVQAGRQFKCKVVACWACRSAHVRRKQVEAARLFENATNADCSLITVNAAEPVGSLNEVAELHRLFRFSLNNWRDAAARDDRRYDRLALYAVLEVQHDGILWRPHWHIVAHHRGIDRQMIAERARDQWPGYRRVQVKAFNEAKAVEDNVTDCVGYGLKFAHQSWSEFASASLFCWIRRRRALRSMCSVMKPREDKPTVGRVLRNMLEFDDGMPVVTGERIYSVTWSPM